MTVRYDGVSRRYVTEYATLRIDCESCHGPGRRHAELAESGALARTGELGLPALDTLPVNASLAVCFQCHALKHELAPHYLPGDSLDLHFSHLLPILAGRPYLPDQRPRTFVYQGTHLASACYLNGAMTCVDCHDPHSQRYRDVVGRPLPGRLDDGQCLACHPSKAENPAAHTRHEPDSPGSRCVACHMPYLQQPLVGDRIPYGRSDHTIPVPRPGFDEGLGVASACALCHRERAVEELAAQARSWWGEPPPLKPAVAEQLRAPPGTPRERAAERLLRPEDRHPMAQAAGISSFLLRHLEPDMGLLEVAAVERLEALAGAGHVDVRALALAALHLARGGDPEVRRFLVERLRAAEAEGLAVRARWTEALRLVGEGYRARRRPGDAAVTFLKALELAPGNARILEALALAYLDLGRFGEAEEAARTALESEPERARSHVALGYALAGSGDAAGSAAALRAAVELDPWDPAAHAALGDILVRSGDEEGAANAYRRALALQPRLASARLGLVRMLAGRGEAEAARAELRRALEYDPADERVRALLTQLEGVAGRE